jgi:hypothetical protein
MNAPVYVMPSILTVQGQQPGAPLEVTDLLRQLLAAQQEQVALMKAQLASQDGSNRWRAFLTRWNEEFPGLGSACKQVLPSLERAYLSLIRDLTEKLVTDADDLSDEFVLMEFLDRYGMRLMQMGNMLNQIGPLADAAQGGEEVKG